MVSLGIFFLWLVASAIVIAVALWALNAIRSGSSPQNSDRRLADLEARVRALTERVWLLEQQTTAEPEAATAPAGERAQAIPPVPAVAEPSAEAAAPTPPTVFKPPAPAASAQLKKPIGLEERIGARWTTWVGVMAILFAIGFFLRWSFENNLIGPGVRVVLGLVVGAALLAGGVLLHRRREVPYLSEGLAGLGLGTLYLSLYAAHAFYGFLSAGGAFASMFLVTVAGAVVSVASGRQITAVLTVLGGLLTPVLLVVEQPDERNLLGYLLVLDLLVLAIARFKTWPSLNRLAWVGTVILFLPTLLDQPESPHPVARLALMSALFLLFLSVPLARGWAARGRDAEVDLILLVGNAAAYFWAVYVTLEPWHPGAEGPYAFALAIAYTALAANYRRRVPQDEPTVLILLGISDIFLTLGIPLALDGPWVTLAWAAQGVVLLSVAPRLVTVIPSWGGAAALLLAAIRVVAIDRYWYPNVVPVWNVTFFVHLVVVIMLAYGGRLATALRADQLKWMTSEALRTFLWVLSAGVLALLFWREPRGLWPAGLLAAETLALGGIALVSRSRAFVIAVPLVVAVLLARILIEDDALARDAAVRLVNSVLVVRIVACIVIGLAGSWLARSGTTVAGALHVGRALSAVAGVVLLYVLSVGWTQHQGAMMDQARADRQGKLLSEIGWQTQVGLSVLWTLYAAAALAWGFVRSSLTLRYAAFCLFGFVIVKVFLFDLSEVQAIYRILSFLVLGLVLLAVSFLYQKLRTPTPN
jgi:uncharacterized membrane protein